MRLRLATRTGLAAFAATIVMLALIGVAFRGQIGEILRDRVDRQLEARAETAPILAAVGDRIARSELNGTVEGARIVPADGRVDGIVEVGLLPVEDLPPIEAPGWTIASADGEDWRLYTVEVFDVPEIGDRTLVQLVAPLGDADDQAGDLRRRAIVIGIAFALGAGLIGYLLGTLAARPLSQLRRDSERLGSAPLGGWRVRADYGTPEVDDVARTLNTNLELLAEETARRGAALESARSFAASAAHELRTPLQSALTSLDIARSGRIDEAEMTSTIDTARRQLERMAASLAVVRALTDAELADPTWFETLDLTELVDAVVADETRRDRTALVTVDAGADVTIDGWAEGLRLAVANIVRNALVHGRPADGSPARVRVEVSERGVVVDDNGRGVPDASRSRILERFERGESEHPGSGLGLALANQVARAHGGSVTVGTSPDGGARVSLLLGGRDRGMPDHGGGLSSPT
jgi:two-component system, OmpR family, sensor histidine kinase PrrB